MATTTNNVYTLAASGAKPQKRSTDPFIMLNEIDVGKISDIDRLKDFIFLCEAGLKFLDVEFALDSETRSIQEFDFNKRTAILEQKKRAERNAIAKIIAVKMALSKKTPKGKAKKENKLSEGLKREGLWNGIGTTYSEWMKPANDKNSKEMREEAEKWLKNTPKPHFVVEVPRLDAINKEIYQMLEG